MAGVVARLRMLIENIDDVKALHEAVMLVRELREQYPWEDDLREIEEKLMQAGRGMRCRPEHESPPTSSDSTS